MFRFINLLNDMIWYEYNFFKIKNNCVIDNFVLFFNCFFILINYFEINKFFCDIE